MLTERKVQTYRKVQTARKVYTEKTLFTSFCLSMLFSLCTLFSVYICLSTLFSLFTPFCLSTLVLSVYTFLCVDRQKGGIRKKRCRQTERCKQRDNNKQTQCLTWAKERHWAYTVSNFTPKRSKTGIGAPSLFSILVLWDLSQMKIVGSLDRSNV